MTTAPHISRTRQGVAAGDHGERARRAVKVFRSMQFGLTAYARAISGNKKITVELAAGTPRTDGVKIYYQPPITLGDPVEHVRRLCDRRDENRKLRCPACAQREEVLVNIYHEIGHIAFESFAETTDMEKRQAINQAIDEWGTKYADRIRRRIESADNFITNSYMGLANLISPYLPFVVNCLEDARVDAAMCNTRKGIRVMLEASTIQIFSEGIERPDGSVQRWCEHPLNAQASIACYLVGSGFTGWSNWLHEEVVEAFTDQQLLELLGRLEGANSASDTYNLAFPVMARLRELGFFRMPDDEPEEGDGDGDQQEDQEGSSGDPSGEEGDPSEEDDNGDGQADSGPSDPSDSSESDRSDDPQTTDSGSGSELNDEDDSDGDAGESDESPDDSDEDSGSGGGDESPQDESDSGDSSEGSSDSESDGSVPDADDSEGTGGQEESDESSADSEGESESDPSEDSSDGDEGDPGDTSGTKDSGSKGSGLDDGEAEADEAGSDESIDETSPLDERIDTGADEGEGGEEAPLNYGEPDDVAGVLEQVHKDDVTVNHMHEDTPEEDKAIQVAIVQGLYFETPSVEITGVREHYYGKPTMEGRSRVDQAWANERYVDWVTSAGDSASIRHALGIDADFDIPESVMGPALLATRRVFTDNAVAAHQRNLKSGRINKRVLGRRAWNDDERLFSKKRLPGKKSYAVLIGIDVSGSTLGENIALAKRAAWAQAELCHRAGIQFAMFAHSASGRGGELGRVRGLHLDIYHIKDFDQPWDPKTQEALKELGSDSENLDGHTMEFYRKRLDEVNATDKILLYYTDGKMPAANHDEELEILQREIRTCKAKNYTLLGVGIRTDSPTRHGLSTIQVDDDEDLKSVVLHLEKQLLRRAQ